MYSGIGYGILLVAPLFAWTFVRMIGFSSPLDIAVSLVLGTSLLVANGLKRPSFDGWLINFSFFGLNLYFLILLSLISDQRNVEWVIYGVVFYTIMLCFDYKKINFTFFKSVAFVAACAVSAYLLGSKGAVYESEQLGSFGRISFENEAYTLSAYACAFLSFVSLFCFVRTKFYLYLFLVVIGLYGVVLAGTRSVYAGLILSTIYIFYCNFSLKEAGVLFIYLIVAVVGSVFFGYFFDAHLADRINHLFENAILGFETFFFGGGVVYDASALGRVFQREYAISLFYLNPALGNGIKEFWVDFPLLQIFSDLGFLVGLLYVFVYFLFPLYCILSRGKNAQLPEVFMYGVYILNVPRLFLHGQPYDWTIYLFLAPVIHVFVFYSGVFSSERSK